MPPNLTPSPKTGVLVRFDEDAFVASHWPGSECGTGTSIAPARSAGRLERASAVCHNALVAPPRLSRRTLLTASAVGVGAVGLDAFALEPNWLQVTEHGVAVQNLPRSLHGLTVAQVTDAHLTDLGRVEGAIVNAVRRHDVRIVALTGDIVDSVERLPLIRELCAELQRAGATVLATLGNWEHWGHVPLEALAKAYADCGARLLVNESVLAEGIRVCATDDSTGGNARLDRALRERAGDPRMLLTHSPELLDRVPPAAGPFALSLAGHTHGGQVRLGPGLVPFVPRGSGRFVAGWYDTPTGPAYVSRGTGTSIAPARFTCRPELPVLRLRVR